MGKYWVAIILFFGVMSCKSGKQLVKKEFKNNEIFRQNFIAILKAMDELTKIEVSREEISEFIYNWMHRKVIFEGKLIYDWETRKFIHESNYPQHLEYYQQYFPKIEKLERENEKNAYSDLLEWFFAETGFELLDEASDSEYQSILDSVKPLDILIKKHQPAMDKKDIYFMKEFILWAMVEYDKLSKNRIEKGNQFKDLYSNFINKL